MVLVFTCTMMIHGDLGPDKSASLLGIYKSFRSEQLITRGGRPEVGGYPPNLIKEKM